MKRTLQKIVDYAVRVAEPELVLLFGSMANQKENEFSDVDLLIILGNAAIKNNVIELVSAYSQELSIKADVLVCSKADLAKSIQQPNSFIKAIFNAGKIVYKRV